jgi:hypothetical protein
MYTFGLHLFPFFDTYDSLRRKKLGGRKEEQKRAKKIGIWTEWKREIGNSKLK